MEANVRRMTTLEENVERKEIRCAEGEESLRMVMEELRRLRKKKEAKRRELQELRWRMGTGEPGTAGTGVFQERQGQSNFNYKLKPDTYSE